MKVKVKTHTRVKKNGVSVVKNHARKKYPRGFHPNFLKHRFQKKAGASSTSDPIGFGRRLKKTHDRGVANTPTVKKSFKADIKTMRGSK